MARAIEQKMNQRAPVTVSVQVRCGGKLHRVTVTAGGALVLENHLKEELAATPILQALGAEAPRCYEVLKQWREEVAGKRHEGFPKNLRAIALVATERGRLRRAQRGRDPLQRPLLDRIEDRISALVLSDMKRTRYRYASSAWVPVDHHVQVRLGPPQFLVFTETTWHRKHRWKALSTVWQIQVPIRWHRLHRLGMSVVDGLFVLDGDIGAGEGIPDTLNVIAARPGKGYDISLAPARLTWEAGCWRLRWRS